MKMQLAMLWLAPMSVLGLAPTIAYCGNGNIGIFFDSDCKTCTRTVEAEDFFTMYVTATLEGASATGITGASFRIAGMPPEWSITLIPNPAVVWNAGNPFSEGMAITFDACQTEGCVLLSTLRVYPTTAPPPDARLEIAPPTFPTCGSLCRLELVGCDAPAYTAYVADGGAAYLNGQSCTVANEPYTWSRVKLMYD